MGHVDPHSIKIIPAAARAFFNANRYAVVGRVISDPARFDNKASCSAFLPPFPSCTPTDPHPRSSSGTRTAISP